MNQSTRTIDPTAHEASLTPPPSPRTARTLVGTQNSAPSGVRRYPIIPRNAISKNVGGSTTRRTVTYASGRRSGIAKSAPRTTTL